MSGPVSADELNAYVDGQLDRERRIAVEAYLQTHADEAASLMQSLRLQDEIRAWLEEPSVPPPALTADLARRFGRLLAYRALLPWLQRGTAVASLILMGWIAHAVVAPARIDMADNPEAVLANDAAQAWRVAQLAQPETAAGAAEQRTVAGEADVLPPGVWPNGMHRVGSEEIDWDGGTALVELVATSQGDQVVLLKATTDASDSNHPSVQTEAGVTTVAWRDDGYAYALSGDAPANELLGLAHLIASRS